MFKEEEKITGGLLEIPLIKIKRERLTIKLGKHDFMKNRLCQTYLTSFLQL